MKKRTERFTPGPWKPGLNKAFSTVLDGYEGKAIYPSKGNNHIAWANIAKGNGHIDMEMAVANARLIAAAPEMYDFLKSLTSFSGEILLATLGEEGKKIYNEALGIIAKVRGDKNE